MKAITIISALFFLTSCNTGSSDQPKKIYRFESAATGIEVKDFRTMVELKKKGALKRVDLKTGEKTTY